MRVRDGVLGHVVLNVANLKKSEKFYRSIVGLKVSARNRRTKMTFMSFGREHHDVALMELAKGAKHVGGQGMPKLHHFCIYVGTNKEVDELYPVLKRRKIPIVSGPRSWKSPATAPSVFSTLTATESRLLATPTSLNLIAERNKSHLEVMNVRSSCHARKDAIDKRIL